MPSISFFEIIKVFVCKAESERQPEPCIYFWMTPSIADAAADILNKAKIFFAKETDTFINWPDNLLDNEPKNHSDWLS